MLRKLKRLLMDLWLYAEYGDTTDQPVGSGRRMPAKDRQLDDIDREYLALGGEA